MSNDEDHDVVLVEWLPRGRGGRVRKYKFLSELMRIAPRIDNLIENQNDAADDDGHGDDDKCSHVVVVEQCGSGGGGGGGADANDDEEDKYSQVVCEQCSSGENPGELLLCDKCDKGFHMSCVRPIVVRVPFGPWFCPSCSGRNQLPPPVQSVSQTKIFDFFKIQKCGAGSLAEHPPAQVARRNRKRTRSLVMHKKRRRLLPFCPLQDSSQRMTQLQSLEAAFSGVHMIFSNKLTYMPGMAPRHANDTKFEKDGMQILPKEDAETVANCIAMCKRGEYPPLIVVYDRNEGYTVEASAPIKDLTFLAEYTGDVDYLKNREHDDCDSLMTLISASDPSKSLVICPDKRGNLARFINGVNNKKTESKKRKNVKCIRYDINGECRVLLVATRDIRKGERLYYDYNGHEQEYPTDHFF